MRIRLIAVLSACLLVATQLVHPGLAVAAPKPPPTPHQTTGSAAGRKHQVAAAATRAKRGTLPAAKPARAKGAVKPYVLHAEPAKPTRSGSRVHDAPAARTMARPVGGFHTVSSVEQPSLDSANTIVYKNTDGSYTAKVYTQPVNTRQSSGVWVRSDATAAALVEGTAAAAAANPTGKGSTTAATYVESSTTQNYNGNGELYVGQYLSHNYNSFLQFGTFGSQFANAYIEGATLELDTEYSGQDSTGSCSAQPVNVSAVSGTWNPSTLAGYPGPALGTQIGTATYAAGTDCSTGRAYQGIGLSVTTFMNWAHNRTANNGLALTAPLTSAAAKEFYANDAYLTITYTPNGEGAAYSEVTYASPWNNKTGWAKVTVRNDGSATWTPTNGFKLTYGIYTVSGTTQTLDTAATPVPAVMPSTVAPNKSATVTATLPALTPGSTYEVCWDMENGTTLFSSLGVTRTCYALPVVNNPPLISAYSPDNNANEYTLTPTLGITAYDPDAYPGKALAYSFSVYAAGSTTALASVTAQAASTWTVPAGLLSWASTYYWTAQVTDTVTASAWSAPDYFTIPSAQQPLITSHLGTPNYDSLIQGVDPSVGDYSTVATDGNLPTANSAVGVEIQRTYNSLAPNLYGAFGAGWSSVLDMRATPDSDGSGSTVITMANGQQMRFGKNGDGTYSPPAGLAGKLTTPLPGFGSDGFTYIDQPGNRYLFTHSATDPVTGQAYYGLTHIWDANGHGIALMWSDQTLTLPSGGTITASEPSGVLLETDGQNGINGPVIGDSEWSGHLLLTTWGVVQVTTSAGTVLNVPHVVTVESGGYFAGPYDTYNTWAYGYNAANDLTSVCPPATTTTTSTACTTYTYTSGTGSGSHFASMVQDSNPSEYWQLGDAAGSASAADGVVVNEGADNAKLTNVTLAQPGVLAGSPATSASFNGTSSSMALPSNLLATSANLTVGMWFKTTQAGGTLFSYQSGAPGTAVTSNYVPSMYVGTDGKLRASFWTGTLAPITSPAAVNDGKWHYAVLTGYGTTQVLYLDGAQAGTVNGKAVAASSAMPYTTVGAGELAGSWPSVPTGNPLGWFNGGIEDVFFLQHPLGLPEVQQEYSSGRNAANELTRTTLPSGRTGNVLTYNALTDRATSVTDADGGTYTIAAPATTGSDNYYSGAVAATRPALYYPMTESSGLDAVNSSGVDNPPGPATDGIYNNVMLGEPGIFGSGGDTAAGFDGSSAYLSLPSGAFNDKSGSASVAMWFSTKTAGGVLFSYQSGPIGTTLTSGWVPALYVGTTGKLYGQFWDGTLSPMVSTSAVNDGNWHLVTLTATGTTQTLYVDGQKQATRSGKSIAGQAASLGLNTVTVGAGFLSSGWTASPSATDVQGYFNGEIAQVGVYQLDIDLTTPTAEQSLYQAKGSSVALTPTTTVAVTDPGGNPESYTYDATNGDRATSFTNALGQTTTYAYDALGYQDATTDPDGHTTSRQHDTAGNVVQETTCQTQSSCQTISFAYYEDTANPLDPLNGRVLKAADARAGSTGTANAAFTTTYTYTANGSIATVTTPPTSGLPNGGTTSYTYYSGTENYTDPYGSAGREPFGLVASVTDARGEVTRYTYNTDGSTREEIDPSGLQTLYRYDTDGHETSKCLISDSYPLTQEEYPGGLGTYTACPQETDYTYDPVGRIVTETDPATTDAVTGVTHTPRVSTTYDADGNVVSQATADTTGGDATRTVSYTYAANDRVAGRTDPDGNVSSFTYDNYGNQVTETEPNGAKYQYAYAPTGEPLTATLLNWTGNPDSPTGPTSLVMDSKAYDPAGRLASDTDSMGRTTAYTYYDNDLMQSATRGYGTAEAVTDSYTYDAAGNRIGECVGQTASGCAKQTTYTLDATDRAVQTTVDPSGANVTTTDHFDPDGNLLSRILKGGGQTRQTSYTYDAQGNTTSQAVATGGAGPAGYWALNDGATTQAADSSGLGNNATLGGGALWSPPGGNSAIFNGTDAQVSTATPVLNTAPGAADVDGFTVEAWVYLNATSTTSDYTAVSQDGTNTSAFQVQYNHTTKSWVFSMPSNDAKAPTTVYTAADPTAAKAGTWTQLVAVYSHGVDWLNLYVNGVEVTGVAGATDNTPFASTGGTLIGRGKANGVAANYFPGKIRNVRLFNRDLSDAEITDLYQSDTATGQAPISLGSVAWWKLNDGESPAAADTSGYGNPATVTGDSYWTSDNGGALVTDGTTGGGAATTGPAVGTTGDFSVGAWAKLTTAGTTWQTVATQQGTQAGGFALDYDGANKHWAFDRAGTDVASPTLDSAQSSAVATAGAWTHLVGTYTAATGALQLYVNGVAQGTATDTTPFASNGPLDIGHGFNAGAASYYFGGEISNVQVYNRVLTTAEIGTLNTSTATAGDAPSVTTWTYDQRGLPKTVTAPDGNAPGAVAANYTSTYQYDEGGNLTSTTNPPVSGVVSTSLAGFDTFGEQVESSDPDGNVVTDTYDADGRLTAVSQPAYTAPGSTTSITPTVLYAYNAMGGRTGLTDARGNATSYVYDQLGNQVEETQPGNEVWTSTYDTDGERLSSTSPTGGRTEATYNAVGQQLTSTQVERTPTAAAYTSTFAYNALGGRTSVTDPLNNVSTATYNALGQQTSITDALHNTTSYAYDVDGVQSKITGPDGTATAYTFDGAGRVTGSQQLSATGTVLAGESRGYDPTGNQLTATDALGNTTTTTYNALGEVTGRVQPATGTTSITTSFGYDAAGNETSYTDPNGNKTLYTYNSLGLREGQIDPTVAGYSSAADSTTTTAYDADGNPVTVTRPGGVVVSSAYDANGNLTGQSGTGAEATTATRTYGYDADNQLTSLSALGGTDTFTYDDRGLPISVGGPSGTATYAYDGAGNVTSRTDATGTATFTYDADNRTATQGDPVTGGTVGYSYYNNGLLSGVTYGTGGATEALTYNGQHLETSDVIGNPSGTVESSATYGYDADGQMTSRTTTGTAGAGSSTFAYDKAGRLTSAVSNGTTTPYTYDPAGNRTSAGSATAAYNARDQLTGVTDGSTSSSYTYTARGTTASTTTGSTTARYTDDAYDDQVTAGSTTYGYDALGRLNSAAGGGGDNTFSYADMSGNVVSDGTQQFGRGPNGSVLSVGTAGSSGTGAFVDNDVHGDVVGTFTGTGTALTGSTAYSPWGRPTATAGTTTDLGYQGGWTDPGTGDVDASSRWYDPANGDFTSRDTAANSPNPAVDANPYAYGNDNPLTESDPSGHDACSSDNLKAIAAAAAAAAAAQARAEKQAWTNMIKEAEDEAAASRAAARDAQRAYDTQKTSADKTANNRTSSRINNPGRSTSPSYNYSSGSDYSYSDSGSSSWLGAAELLAVGAIAVGVIGLVSAVASGGWLGLALFASTSPGCGASGVPTAPHVKATITTAAFQAPTNTAVAAPTTQPSVNAILRDSTSTDTDTSSENENESDPDNPGPIVDTTTQNPGTCLNDPLPGSTPSTENGGWEYYAPVGYGGRAQGAVVCASKTNPNYNTPTRTYAGSAHARAMAAMYRVGANGCHLAPSVLGGSGNQSNVAACWRTTNVGTPSMRSFERQAQNLVKAGNVVEYAAIPIYHDAKSTVPTGFELGYIAETPGGQYVAANQVTVKNDGNGLLPNLGN
jgi:RHS repeat-associated protein